MLLVPNEGAAKQSGPVTVCVMLVGSRVGSSTTIGSKYRCVNPSKGNKAESVAAEA